MLAGFGELPAISRTPRRWFQALLKGVNASGSLDARPQPLHKESKQSWKSVKMGEGSKVEKCRGNGKHTRFCRGQNCVLARKSARNPARAEESCFLALTDHQGLPVQAHL